MQASCQHCPSQGQQQDRRRRHGARAAGPTPRAKSGRRDRLRNRRHCPQALQKRVCSVPADYRALRTFMTPANQPTFVDRGSCHSEPTSFVIPRIPSLSLQAAVVIASRLFLVIPSRPSFVIPSRLSFVIPSRLSFVIPSRRRGISAARNAEIPPPAQGRGRDDSAAHSEPPFLRHSEPPFLRHSEPKARNLRRPQCRDRCPESAPVSG